MWRGKIQMPKSRAANRPVALSPHLAAVFSVQRPIDPNLLVFRTKKGTPWDTNLLVKRELRPLCERLGIVPRGLHAFRHGQGTLLDQMNVPVKVRQERLGHTDPSLTIGTYTHAISSDERKAKRIDLLAGARDPPTPVDRFHAGHHPRQIPSDRQVCAG